MDVPLKLCHRDRGTWAGLICFVALSVPWTIFEVFTFPVGDTASDNLIFIMLIFVFACFCSLLGVGVARGTLWLIIFSLLLLILVNGGYIYFITNH